MVKMDFAKAYVGSHGGQLPEDMVVSDGLNNYDMRKSIASEMMDGGFTVRKALSTLGNLYATGTQYSGTAGSVPTLIPIYVDPEIIDLTRRATPLVELIPRVTNYGKTADYNKITAIATAQALAEDAALAEQNETYARSAVAIKFLYSIGRVTGPMFAASKQYLASGGYIDALSLEVKNKTLALKRLEEAMILLGDPATNWTEPVNSTLISGVDSFAGIYFQLITAAVYGGAPGNSSPTAPTGNQMDLAGAALAISHIRTAIRTARTRGGEPNLMVCDYATYDEIKGLIQDQLRYISTTTIAWGITTVSFEGIPIIASRFLNTTAGTGALTVYTSRSVFFLDTNVIEMRVLQDVSYEELAKTNDSVKFMLKCYEALVVKAPQFNMVLFGHS